MSYEPDPIDTSRIEIPAELESLIERLARHHHDVWALRRLGEGWTHGPERDEDAKRHPDLVPYERLPESEKEFDRQAGRETLKVIQALGFRISR